MDHRPALPIDAAPREAVKARANQDRVSPAAWRQRQLDKPGQDVMSAEDSQSDASMEEVMLDLAWVHFPR